MYCGFPHKTCYSLPAFSESIRPQNNLNGSYLCKCGKIHLQVNSNTQDSTSQEIWQQKELCPTTAASPSSQDKELLQKQKHEMYLQTPSLGWRMQVTTESLKSPSRKLLHYVSIFLRKYTIGDSILNPFQHYSQITRPHSSWLPIWIFWYKTGVTQTVAQTI